MEFFWSLTESPFSLRVNISSSKPLKLTSVEDELFVADAAVVVVEAAAAAPFAVDVAAVVAAAATAIWLIAVWDGIFFSLLTFRDVSLMLLLEL